MYTPRSQCIHQAYRLRPHLLTGLSYTERRLRRIEAWPQLKQITSRSDPHHLIRLDPLSVFLLFYAVAVMIALYVFSLGFTDLTTQATKYVIIAVVAATFAPILVGGYFYKEWGPITRPIFYKRNKKSEF